MTNKVGKDELKKLFESAMNEIDLSVYTDSSTGLFKTKLSDTDISSGADTGLVGVSADDLEGFAKTKPEEGQLDDNDIQHFIDNPDQIDTKTQSILIAIARTGSESWLQGRVDKAQEIYNQKQKELNSYANVKKKLEDLHSALGEKTNSLATPSKRVACAASLAFPTPSPITSPKEGTLTTVFHVVRLLINPSARPAFVKMAGAFTVSPKYVEGEPRIEPASSIPVFP